MKKIEVKKSFWNNENKKFIKNKKKFRHQNLQKLLFIKKKYKHMFYIKDNISFCRFCNKISNSKSIALNK